MKPYIGKDNLISEKKIRNLCFLLLTLYSCAYDSLGEAAHTPPLISFDSLHRKILFIFNVKNVHFTYNSITFLLESMLNMTPVFLDYGLNPFFRGRWLI
jgi:hypothetical protein